MRLNLKTFVGLVMTVAVLGAACNRRGADADRVATDSCRKLVTSTGESCRSMAESTKRAGVSEAQALSTCLDVSNSVAVMQKRVDDSRPWMEAVHREICNANCEYGADPVGKDAIALDDRLMKACVERFERGVEERTSAP